MSFSGHFFETGRGLRWRGGREERIQVDHAKALSVLKLDTLTPQYFTSGEDNRKRMRSRGWRSRKIPAANGNSSVANRSHFL